jgi:hypothetical protein
MSFSYVVKTEVIIRQSGLLIRYKDD